MTSEENLLFSANIVLQGYDAGNSAAFKNRFQAIEKLESLKELQFSEEPLNINFLGEAIPQEKREELTARFLPVVKYTDTTKNLSVEYLSFEKKLQIHDLSLNTMPLFLTLTKVLVEELSNQVEAFGFNFLCEYKPGIKLRPVLPSAEQELKKASLLKEKKLESLAIRFAYTEDDYKKSFRLEPKVDDEGSQQGFILVSNYHYDLQQESLLSKVRTCILEQINENYEKLLTEFKTLSQEMIFPA